MRRAVILVLLLLTMFSGALLAQEGHGYEIGGFAGYSLWQERDFRLGSPQAVPPIGMKLDYDDEFVYGVRFNFLSRKFWGGELSYGYQRNTVSIARESL